ncbi:response regulator receiver protein [halophilic archaeon]|nr:response regulator receiver protein [halophilic archaeon]
MPPSSGSDDSHSFPPYERTELPDDDMFFEQLVHSALDGFLTVDETATICFANEAASTLFGYGMDELVGKSIAELFPDRYHDEYLTELQQYLHDPETPVEHTDLERIGCHKDGSEIPLSFSVREHTYRGERLFTAVLRDISEQKRQQEDLEAATEKYRTLIEAAPDAIFVADAETGIIQEANQAATKLLGKSATEIEGMHQIDLHPSEDTERYKQLFQGHHQRGGVFDQDHNLEVVGANSQHIPVAISANTTQLQDRQVIQGIFRDVSDQRRREDALQSLHTTTQRMLGMMSAEEICTEAVRTATKVLELPITGIHLHNPDEHLLEPKVTSEEVTAVLGDPVPAFSPEDQLVWDVFDTGSYRIIHDVQNVADQLSRDTPIRSAIILPLDEHGVLITSSTSVRDFDRIDVDLMRVLAANTEAALTRAERERAIARQRDELETVNRLNTIIRDINQTLVAAPTREEIEQTVCEQFANSDGYPGALIADLMSVESGLNLRIVAGIDDQYLDAVDAAAPATEQGPAAMTLRTGTLTVEEDIATSSTFPDAVKEEAVERGYKSVVCIPLGYGDTTYGVLVVYASQPALVGEPEQTIFAELGETIGYAINAAESKKLLHTDQVLELEFSLRDTDAFFFSVSDELEGSITLDGVVPSADGMLLFYVTATDIDPNRLLERAQTAASVEQARMIAETEKDSAFEFVFRGTETASQMLIERGAYIKSGQATDGQGTLTIEVPADTEVRPFIEAVQNIYPNASLHAKRQRTQPVHSRTSFLGKIEETLTDRQLEILRISFHSGYFEYPRESTGEALANTLEIASPTFHQHLQAGLQNLLTLLLATDGEPHHR